MILYIHSHTIFISKVFVGGMGLNAYFAYTVVPTFFYDIFAKRMLVFKAVWLMLVQACQ